jgi:hypothetical protein
MNNGSTMNSHSMRTARPTLGNRWFALWQRMAVALTLVCLTMMLGCAGVNAVRPAVVSQVSSQPLQEQASVTGPPAPDSQQPQPLAVSQQIAHSQQPGPWSNVNQTAVNQTANSEQYAESPETQVTQGQPEYQTVPSVDPQIALVGYQEQQAMQQEQQAIQPALQLSQPNTFNNPGMPPHQTTEVRAGQPASLGIPRQMLGHHPGQPTAAPVSMPQQTVQTGGPNFPAPPVPNSQQFPTQVASHMGNVINIQGARFRQSPKTATEIMIAFKAENDRLKQEIKLGKQARMNLKEQLSFQQQLNQKTESQLGKSRDQAMRLREMVAKLQVRVERLVVEKDDIKQQSEAALRNIETNLDSVLMNSISRARKKPVSMN